jgi:stage II sporulation protein E
MNIYSYNLYSVLTQKTSVKEVVMLFKRNSFPDKPASYGVLAGASGLPKTVGISGDSYMCRKLPNARYTVAIADGMGTGIHAAECSSFMLDSLYQLLKVGIDHNTVMQTLNHAVTVHNTDESFSTLDLAVFDLNEGICHMYKSGAAPTIVDRHGEIGIIKLPSVPLGILDRPTYRHISFKIEHGDRYFFMTDGVSEAIPPDDDLSWACSIVQEHPEDKPRLVAERLIWGATLRYGQSERDDMTVVGLEIL